MRKFVESLELFGKQLETALGEEPSIWISGGSPADGVPRVPLSDFFGWYLRAAHGAVYRRDGGAFRRIAGFGENPAGVALDSPACRWISEHGPLLRSRLTLSDLSAEDAERLIGELDRLNAHALVPVMLNDEAWGFLLGGPRAEGTYSEGDSLYLALYGMEILRCQYRKQAGLPTASAAHSNREYRLLRELREMWLSLRPQAGVRVLLFDQEPEVAAAFARYFGPAGFELIAHEREQAAIDAVREKRPQIALLDLDPRRPLPQRLLRGLRVLVPQSPVAGVTTGRRALQELARQAGVQQIFLKPCRFAELGSWVLEAAIGSVLGVQAVQATQESCLIVDDEQEVTQALKEHFQVKGYRVCSATSAENAMPIAAEERPKLVLMDWKLPGSAGASAIGRIRRVSPASRVVVLSSSVQEAPRAAHGTPADAYCLKPVPLDELDRIVENLLMEPSHA